ncbi:MAG TPA: glycosyltransferase family 4 protein [Bacillales bacterium]|nr:glycosyltransferase family 4 protein [Bacillales bacterium]
MEIALIATEKLPVPPVRGGAIQIYLQSFSPLVAKKHHVTVFSVRDPDLPDEDQVDGVDHIHIDADHYVSGVAEHLKTGNFDLVHVCNRPAWIRTLCGAAPDSKFVLSVHNEMFAPEKISWAEGEACIRLVDQLTTVSDYIGETICERFPEARSKVETVNSGVDLDIFKPAWTDEGRVIRNNMRQQLDLEGKKVILFVGRLSKVKGPHILLEAIPEIVKSHPEAVVVFVGSKWFGENNVNKYVQFLYTLGALYPENVRFIKFVKPSDIHKLYTMSDVFVCTSQWQEPLARVHYEAMAAGLPIITTARGGNSEVINEGQNGFVIEQFEDAGQYVVKINQLLNDDTLRRRIGESGRAYAESRFGWEHVADHLQQIYERTAYGRGGDSLGRKASGTSG